MGSYKRTGELPAMMLLCETFVSGQINGQEIPKQVWDSY